MSATNVQTSGNPQIPQEIIDQPRSKYARKNVDKNQIAKIKAENPNLSQKQIGQIVGIHDSQVSRVLKEYGLTESDTKKYKDARSDIFAGLQSRIILEHLKDDRLKEMNPQTACLWFNSLYNNERLERGQATNINVSAELKLTRQAFEEYLQADSGRQQSIHSIVDISHAD
jgi:predicted transcriptional regulator